MTNEELDSGWLRAATFGALDGLTTSSAILFGLVGSALSTHNIVLAELLEPDYESMQNGVC